MDEGDIADSIMEYAPDNGFPDNADPDTISFCEVTYDAQGTAIFTFDYVEEEEEIEDDEDEDSSDD